MLPLTHQFHYFTCRSNEINGEKIHSTFNCTTKCAACVRSCNFGAIVKDYSKWKKINKCVLIKYYIFGNLYAIIAFRQCTCRYSYLRKAELPKFILS